MNTPLSDEMQALLNYANETTEGADSTLGDAVKTLCDGYMQGGGGDLPTFIDYITNTGAYWNPIYIDLGIPCPNRNLESGTVEIKVDMQYNPSAGSGLTHVLGCTINEGDINNEGSVYTYGDFALQMRGCSSQFHINSTLKERKTYRYKYNVGGSLIGYPTINGEEVETSGADISASLPIGNFALFGSYREGWGRLDCNTDTIRIFGIKIWRNDVLVLDGHPARDDVGAGIYNLVDGTMHHGATVSSIVGVEF